MASRVARGPPAKKEMNSASLRFLLDESFCDTRVVAVPGPDFIWTRTDRDLRVRVAPRPTAPWIEVSTNVTLFKGR